MLIHKMYKEKCIKKKIMNLQMRKNESTGWKVLKQLFNVLNLNTKTYTQK